MKKCVIMLFTIFCFILVQGTGQAAPLNPSFELIEVGTPPVWPSGFLNIKPQNWTVTGQAGATGAYTATGGLGTISPVDESQMAWIGFIDYFPTDGGNDTNDYTEVTESPENYVGSATGSSVYPVVGGNPNALYGLSSISQNFTVDDPYSTIAFQYNFFSWDGDPSIPNAPSDFLTFIVNGVAVETIWANDIFYRYDPATGAENIEFTGWTTFSYDLDGQTDIELMIAVGATVNDPDASIVTSLGYTSWAFIDDLTVTGGQPVPEPTSLLLLGAGLVGLAGFCRRKFHRRR